MLERVARFEAKDGDQLLAAEHVLALGLRGLRRVPLVNGGLECELALGTV